MMVMIRLTMVKMVRTVVKIRLAMVKMVRMRRKMLTRWR